MKISLINCFLITLVLIIQDVKAQRNNIRPETASVSTEVSPAFITDFNYSIKNNRIQLDWSVKNNENADQFIIEKVSNGKTFSMVALVFSTEKYDIDNYQFFEKAGNKAVSYRIKIIHKDHTFEYSDTLTTANKKSDQ